MYICFTCEAVTPDSHEAWCPYAHPLDQWTPPRHSSAVDLELDGIPYEAVLDAEIAMLGEAVAL